MIKNVLVFMLSTRYSCPILIKIDFINRFSKNTQISCHENLVSGSRDVPCGRTERDGRDEVNSHFSQFCERA
jgi:hypothetical protein